MQDKSKSLSTTKPPLTEVEKLKRRVKKLKTDCDFWRDAYIRAGDIIRTVEDIKQKAHHWEQEYYRVKCEQLERSRHGITLMVSGVKRGLMPMDLVNQWTHDHLLN